MGSIGPTTGLGVGYGLGTILRAAELLQAAGDDGLGGVETLEQLGGTVKDNGGGYLIRALREHGFLVQNRETRVFIMKTAPIEKGFWVRHPEHGVVQIVFDRPGFDSVIVVPLGRGDRIKTVRTVLSGI